MSSLLCASAALDLQVGHIDVLLQCAGRPERDAFAVAADVVPALLVHCLGVRLQAALRPKGDALTVGARVVPALLVLRLDASSGLQVYKKRQRFCLLLHKFY